MLFLETSCPVATMDYDHDLVADEGIRLVQARSGSAGAAPQTAANER